jgi:diguanylate cyclase (GGDEF)-like protein
MLDIDRFKSVNDQWGHLAGDVVLKGVADTIRKRSRREDVLARFGGEEFALLLPEIDLKGAAVMAEKVRKNVERTVFEFDDAQIAVTISAGVAAMKRADTPESLVRRADELLYSAKAGGRNQVVS